MVARTGPRTSRPERTGFKYQERDLSQVKKRAERQLGRFDSPFKSDVTMFKARVGDNAVRILPPTWDNHDHFGLTVFMHEYVGSEESTYLCLKKMGVSKRCPCCDAADEMKRDGDADEAKATQWREKVLYWILDRESDDPDSPIVWSVSTRMDQDITTRTMDKRTDKVIHIDHPDDGYDLLFTRVGQGLKTRYQGVQFDRQSSPIHEKQKVQDEILLFIEENPLPSILHYYDEEYLEGVMNGTIERKDEALDREVERGRRVGRDEPAPRERARSTREEEPEARPSSRRSLDPDDGDRRESSRRSGGTTEEDRGSRRSQSTREQRDDDRETADSFRREAGGGYTRREEPGREELEQEEDRPTNRRVSSRSRSEDDDAATTTRRGRNDDPEPPRSRRGDDNGEDNGRAGGRERRTEASRDDRGRDSGNGSTRSRGRSEEPAEEQEEEIAPPPRTQSRVRPAGSDREETRRVGSGRQQYRD
jgi:hypothetical protein